MVLSKDTNPLNSVYLIGALLLDVINKNGKKPLDFIETYNEVNQVHSIPMKQFMFAIDWLFILGTIELSPKLEISKCS